MMQYFGINLLKFLETLILISDNFRLYILSLWFKMFSLLKELRLNSPTTKRKTNLTIEKSSKHKFTAKVCGNDIQSKYCFCLFTFRGAPDVKTKLPSSSIK